MQTIYNTEEISLSQKESIENIRKKYMHNLSSHAFANLYLWRNQMELSVYLEEDFFAVKSVRGGYNTWFFPCGNEEKVKKFISDGIKTDGFALLYLREKDTEWLKNNFGDDFIINRDDSSDEYVCSVKGYLELEGSTYSRIRRRINHILREHTVYAEKLDEKNVQYATQIVDEWIKNTSNNEGHMLADNAVSYEAISIREQLDLNGIVLFVDDTPVAVMMGFHIDDNTLDICVGKSLRTAPRGTVLLAVREYAAAFGEGYEYLNVEEDLGIEGLRIQKEEMKPVFKNLVTVAVLK